MSHEADFDEYNTEGESPAVRDMVAWFLSEYENPAESCPVESGEYQYIWGGPFNAEEVLREKYEGEAHEADLARAIEILEVGDEWAKVPPDDEDDEEPEDDPESDSEDEP